jgi:proteasome accessory factor C
VPVEEICTRFAISRTELLADLELLWFVGTPPYSPADLIEADVHDDVVWIRYADAFRAPLRLTPEQGLALLAAGHGLASVPGADAEGPLARGLAKLGAALGVDGRIAVDLGPVPQDLLDVLRTATAEGQVLELDYYSHNRNRRAHRVVEPHQVFVDQGAWYLAAYCRLAEAPRTFRVERIHTATPTGEVVDPPERGLDPTGVAPRAFTASSSAGERVVLDLTPADRWLVEQIPCEVLDEAPDGRTRIALIATAPAWLERLLLRLGPGAEVVEGPAGVAAAAATRILARYQG